MSEELFELHIDHVSVDVDTYKLAAKLSSLLKIEAQQLEKKLVKVKVLHGRSEMLKSGLTNNEATHLQDKLNKIAVVTTIKAEWALVPIEKTVVKDTFACPSCGLQQEIDEGKAKICSACGIVKDKYELAQKRKQLEAERLQQERLIEQGMRNKTFKSMEQRNEAFLNKKNNKLRAKNKEFNIATFSTFLLIFSAVSISGYMYFDQQQKDAKKGVEKSQEINMTQGDVIRPILPAPVETAVTGDHDDMLEELGNPYRQLANASSLPPITMKDAPNYVNKLLDKNKNHLPTADVATLGNISTIYEELDETNREASDFKEIKKLANSVSDKGIREQLIKQASWQEVESGVKTFDDFGIRSVQRGGENVDSVELIYKDISIYIKDYRYKKAAKVAGKIQDPYLQAVAFSKILDSQFYLDLEGAQQQRNKIKAVSEQYGLTQIQKALALGLLYQADRRFGRGDVAEVTFEQLELAVDDIMDEKEKVETLVQLGEDQREGLNFTDAQYFLDAAHQQLEDMRLSSTDADRFYGLLAQNYAKLFEFGQANTLMAKIKNKQEKNRIASAVALIEKKAAL